MQVGRPDRSLLTYWRTFIAELLPCNILINILRRLIAFNVNHSQAKKILLLLVE